VIAANAPSRRRDGARAAAAAAPWGTPQRAYNPRAKLQKLCNQLLKRNARVLARAMQGICAGARAASSEQSAPVTVLT